MSEKLTLTSTGVISAMETLNRELLAEHRRLNQALVDLTDCLRLFVDAVREYAIFMLDSEGRVVSWNAGAKRIKGYDDNEIIGKHFSIFYLKEDRAAGKPESELKNAATKGRHEDRGWRVRKDGSRFLADVVITALYDDRGQLRGFGKITRELPTSEAEEAMRPKQAANRR